MNWSRGLLRLWMIFTVLWVSGVGWAAYNEMRSTVVRKADGTVERWVKVNDAITLEHFHALQEGRKPDADLLEALNSWPYYLYKRREFDFSHGR